LHAYQTRVDAGDCAELSDHVLLIGVHFQHLPTGRLSGVVVVTSTSDVLELRVRRSADWQSSEVRANAQHAF
jgi:hypothetical protein